MKKNSALGIFALLTGLFFQQVYAGNALPAPRGPQVAPPPVPVPVNVDPIVTGTMKLHPFNRIAIEGPFDVELVGNMPSSDLRYIGNDSVIQGISAVVRNNTLYVSMNKKKVYNRGGKQAMVIIRAGQVEDLFYEGAGSFSAIGLTAPYVDVTLRNQGPVVFRTPNLHLHYLDVGGKGPVTVGDLDARNLKVVLRGNNKIYLKGHANVENVMANGDCEIRMDALDSSFLRVRGRHGAHIHLAGHVQVMEAFLYDHAWFDGKDLLAQKAYVKTYDEGRADIQVSEYQSTLASDHSNIFYYRKALHHGDYMHRSGAVLQMDNLEEG